MSVLASLASSAAESGAGASSSLDKSPPTKDASVADGSGLETGLSIGSDDGTVGASAGASAIIDGSCGVVVATSADNLTAGP